MDEQRQDDQEKLIYNRSVLLQNIDMKTIETGGVRGSGRSVQTVQHENDDMY